jgi:hypothetical protein
MQELSRRPSSRELRSFGLTVGGVFLALSLWWIYRRKFGAVAPIFAALGGVLVLLGTLAPRSLAVPHRGWMALAEGLSFVMTRVILFIVFFLVVTPIGWIRRALGGDPLRRRAAPAASYWEPYSKRQKDPRHYEKLY